MTQQPGSPASWLRLARSDLALAREFNLQDVLLGTLCYLCQQAVEKSLKAVLVAYGMDAPKTHIIRDLVSLLPDKADKIDSLDKAYVLTKYTRKGRYPDDRREVTRLEYQRALSLAEEISVWANKEIRRAKQSQ